ncbi:MAG: hypothetical protein K2L49_08340 [Muribaculaceae bacterium]|nr:hypothetical protein [Muribaculaceae bacterium]
MKHLLLYILTALICTGCAQSRSDRIIAEVTMLMNRGDLEALDSVRMSLLMNPVMAREAVQRASTTHPEYNYGIMLGVALPPEEAAQTFVNWVDSRSKNATDTVKWVFSSMINAAATCSRPDEYDLLTASIDSAMMRLPIDRRARAMAICSTPAQLGRHLRRDSDKEIIDAVIKILSADTSSMNIFKKSLK